MEPLYLLAGLVVVGVAAQWLAARIHVPAIVLLLASGLVLGPVTGIVRPDEIFGDLLRPLVSLAVGVVLFEGGLTLRFREARSLGWPLLSLVVVGLVVTFSLATVLGHYVAGLSWATAAVVGAILVVTGPTVIKPMLRQAQLAPRPARLLKWESIVNDALGALLAVIVLEVALVSGGHGGRSGGSIALGVATAALAGWFAGWFSGRALSGGWVPEHLKSPFILAAVLAVFVGSDALFHEAGLLAVTIMGVVLANGESSPSVEGIRHFKEDVTTLLVAQLFLVLSARLQLADLTMLLSGAGAFVLLVLFVVRPVTALVALGPSSYHWKEIALIGWIAPRGVVAAAMAAALQPKLVEAGYEDAERMVPILFGVILSTVVLHGLTLGPLARRLGLAARGRNGLLIVGASRWAIELSDALKNAGVSVVVIDRNWRNTSQARMRGIETVYGDVLDEEELDELPLERMSLMLAATDDDHYNALVCNSMAKSFGRANCLQITPSEGDMEESHLTGRLPWGEEASFSALTTRYWRGERFKVSQLSEQFDWDAFREQRPDAAVLFEVRPGELAPLPAGKAPEADSRVVYVAPKTP